MAPHHVYITTTLPYVNADPHVGFALEIVQADAFARYRRLSGDVVFFNTGTDEHGQKIWEKAHEEGTDVQVYVDRNAAQVERLKEALDLSFDRFIRTTDADHVAAAQELWKRCDAAGDIYKKKYTGLYCVGCEKFLQERDLVDGLCPLHTGRAPVELEEENYFFALSRYEGALIEYLERPGVIIPEYRRQEALAFVRAGLEDFSISRERARMSWGVPVPGDDAQIMYVWFDALTNYISTLGWPEDADGNFTKFWKDGTTVQMAGKDQVRFQSIMWQAMLFSAELPPTDQIFYHGFVNSGGQRMSKSLGNVISPFDMVARYGVDATRYILVRHVHPTDDTDITWERMDEWYTAHLANGLGNLTARIMKMAEDNLDTPVAVPEAPVHDVAYAGAMAAFEFQQGMDYIWQRIGALDERITEERPFAVVKDDPEQGKRIITELVVGLREVATLLAPAMPQTSERILTAISANQKPETLFARLEA